MTEHSEHQHPVSSPMSMPTPAGMTPGMEVIAYRLSLVESEVSGVDRKLDKLQSLITENYISSQTLGLILEPMRGAIKELDDERRERERTEAGDRRQVRMILYGAIASPIAAILVAAIVAAVVVGLKS